MLSETIPDPDRPATPRICDLVRLRPGNRHGVDPELWLLVVDDVPHEPGTVEVWLQPDHPRHMDWAAAITGADVAAIIPADAETSEHLPEDTP
jgi:hypothetical protein